MVIPLQGTPSLNLWATACPIVQRIPHGRHWGLLHCPHHKMVRNPQHSRSTPRSLPSWLLWLMDQKCPSWDRPASKSDSAPSLELELEDVVVQQNSNCSALLGVDVLQRKDRHAGASYNTPRAIRRRADGHLLQPPQDTYTIAIAPLMPTRDKKEKL